MFLQGKQRILYRSDENLALISPKNLPHKTSEKENRLIINILVKRKDFTYKTSEKEIRLIIDILFQRKDFTHQDSPKPLDLPNHKSYYLTNNYLL